METRPNLQRGDTGESVKILHQALIENGFNVGDDGSEGIYGRDTYNAVTMFQASHIDQEGKALKVDGLVGPKTWWSLDNPAGAQQNQRDQDAPPSSQRLDGDNVRIPTAALEAALKELGLNVKEVPNGSNRGERIDVYTNYVGKPEDVKGPPWCAYFVSWCFAQNGFGRSPFGRIGGAQNIALWAKKHNCCLIPGAAQPRLGDIFVIARDDVHGHTGIVRASQGDSIWTVEGNAGNAVRSLRRKVADITNFVRVTDNLLTK